MKLELKKKIKPDTKILSLCLGAYYTTHMATKIEKFCFMNEIKTIQELKEFFDKEGGVDVFERSVRLYNNSNLGLKSFDLIRQILKIYND